MLPPGHIAGGYLTALGYLSFTHPAVSTDQQALLLLWGAIVGFLPDLDMFAAFRGSKTFIARQGINHRRFVTHSPLPWCVVGISCAALTHDPFWISVGILGWLASWSHFVLDSIQYGIMWLWPFSLRLYSIRDTGLEMVIESRDFWGYWSSFIRQYIRLFRLTFVLEVFLVLGAVGVVLK